MGIFSHFNFDSENPLNRFRQAATPSHLQSVARRLLVPLPAAGSAWPMTSLKSQRVMRHRNTIGTVVAGSLCLTHCSFGDCKLPAQLVSPWPLHHAPVGSTLLQRERRVQCQRFTPFRLAGGGGTMVMSMFMSDKNVPCSPRKMALSQLNYGCSISYLNTYLHFNLN